MGTPLTRRFEELLAWQKGRQLATEIYDLTGRETFVRDHLLRNQMRDASRSSMHTIAQRYDADTSAEFSRFLKIARRSTSEVQSELYLALDRRCTSQDERRV